MRKVLVSFLYLTGFALAVIAGFSGCTPQGVNVPAVRTVCQGYCPVNHNAP